MKNSMKQSGRQTLSLSKGFTAVELLITLFIAATFLMSGYQLYNLIIKDGGETRAQARANNVAYDYMQRYKSGAVNPCVALTPLTNSSITVDNLTDVTVSVAITCPYPDTTSVSKVLVTLKYDSPQLTVSNGVYVTPQGIANNGIVLNLDAGNIVSYPGSGTIWNDLSGYGNNVTLANGVGYLGSYGGELVFDGIDVFCPQVTYSDTLSFTSSFTIEATAKITAYQAGSYYSMTNMILARGPASTFNYALQISNSTTIQFVKRTDPEGLQFSSFTVPILTNNISSIILTYAGNSLSLYLNGTYISSVTVTNVQPGVNDTFFVGGFGATQNTNFIGKIYNIRLYNRALSTSEVQDKFAALRGQYGL